MNFGRTSLLGNATHPRSAGLPLLSARQLEALDAVEKIARATELEITTPSSITWLFYINMTGSPMEDRRWSGDI